MKLSFKFSNLLGTVYRKGNILFSPDGNSVISPVGNRITIFDLKNNKSETLPIESRYNFTSIALAPNGCILIAVNEGTQILAFLYNFVIVTFFAVAKENNVLVYQAPCSHRRVYNPFALEQVFHAAYSETTCIDWTTDSRVLAVGSKDMSTKICALERFSNLSIYTLGSHTDNIVGCFFDENSLDLCTVSRNGQLCVWECSVDIGGLMPPTEQVEQQQKDCDDEDNMTDAKKRKLDEKEEETDDKNSKVFYKRRAKVYLKDSLKAGNSVMLTSAAYHRKSHILVTGFSNGSFLLQEIPDCNLIHSLSISEQDISAVAFNCTGDWIALGSSYMGQLVVWEWQSESFVLKQQGHFNTMSCLAYSPDGQYIVTGGDDGKVKVWNTGTGFCFVTFTEHESGISGVTFTQSGKAILSASLDGTVRAFDLQRYRNFRTFTSPQRTQFSCLAVDPSGEIVCAGSQDTFEIFVWSLQTGRLLEVLSGHEAPVSGISFSPNQAILVSASWDKTVRVWDVFESKGSRETLPVTSDALTVQFRPDGQEFAVATLDGQILFFDINTSVQTGSIEGRNDLGAGRRDTDLVTAKKLQGSQAFTTLCYSTDGESILAGGRSKNVCIYHVGEQLLMKKFEITCNHSLDGVDVSSFVRMNKNINGSNCTNLFTGRAWSTATTEGLLIYSLDHNLLFDPFQLEANITPTEIRKTLREKKHSKALIMALRLNEQPLLMEILEGTPFENVELVCHSLPHVYVEKLLDFLGNKLESSRHIEFYLTWIHQLLLSHGSALKSRSTFILGTLHTLQKNLTRWNEDLGKICNHNKYTSQYLISLWKNQLNKTKRSEEEEDNSDIEDQILISRTEFDMSEESMHSD
ncbi:periodic tryptophan protein 2 homolog [Limulus polyphemus]|uniref:Periodic tryptophan protein 2 homolog n=1 Tax=Limulus polyphemus TaxID=6850 RepID=A0ABM1TP01_LIMPO|nr:periodic tryptophan protein 2 homolog [Limulus polyphemus]